MSAEFLRVGVRERKLREEGFETYVVQGDRKKILSVIEG